MNNNTNARNSRLERLDLLIKEYEKQRLFLYGAGNRGRVALNNLKQIHRDHLVKGFVDDNAKESELVGKPVYSIDELPETDLNCCIFLPTTNCVKKMVDRLSKKGVPVEHVVFIPELMITNILGSQIQTEKTNLVYSYLSDPLSKFVFKSIIDIYLTGNIGVLSQTMGERQYFPVIGMSDHIPGFAFDENECFVDCGAFDGDTIKEFRELTQERFGRVYAFEADPGNYRKLFERFGDDKRVVIRDEAVWSSKCELKFCANNGSSSAIDEIGTVCIKAVAIDDVIPKNEDVSFIKMDIEGSELEALKGGTELIKRCHPKLAICIYHKLEDMWEIPLYIKSLFGGYNIYIRNYQDRLDEIVCYAIP